MIQRTPKRLAASFAALLFLLNTAGEGFGLHPCPFHGSLQDHPEAAEASAPAAADPHAHHRGEHAESPVPGDHHDGAPCTHIEACLTATAAVLPVDLRAVLVWSFESTASRNFVAVDRQLPSLPPFFLPYSLAPPPRG